MVFQKLLKLAIVDALDHVWSGTGLTPSKETRDAILIAAETISNSVQRDFITANKEELLSKETWDRATLLAAKRLARSLHESSHSIEPPPTSLTELATTTAP